MKTNRTDSSAQSWFRSANCDARYGVALVAIGRLVGTLRPDALIADTLSVKTTVVPALHAAATIAESLMRTLWCAS